jgi:hypothetical protein
LPVNSQTFDAMNELPFHNDRFDTVCSHMFLNMKFSQEELRYVLLGMREYQKMEDLTFFQSEMNMMSIIRNG